jgi:hypothetical protein
MIKLPRTLHIEGSRLPKGKTDPEAVEFNKLAGQFLVVEEKVDGTGVSLFFDKDWNLQIWHRGSPANSKEFYQLHRWAANYTNQLFDTLETRYALFGEWMHQKHTIFYDSLPHYFLESDIYDSKENVWLSTKARNQLLTKCRPFMFSVPIEKAFKPTRLVDVTRLVTRPMYQSLHWRERLWKSCERFNLNLEEVLKQTDQSDLMEGLYIKHEDDQKVIGRYKYVRYEFVENIINSGSHLRDRQPIPNLLSSEIF